MGRIILLLISDVGEDLVRALRCALERAFAREMTAHMKIGRLEYAYDTKRGQYISPRLLGRLRRIKKSRGDMILGLVDVDLYSPGYDFVFGEADVGVGVGTVSIYRLRPENYGRPPDSGLLEARMIKEAIHEMGHLYGLGHCPDPKCVMSFSVSLAAVDRKTKEFCRICRRRLRPE